jgi:tRNA C32,U32 (ribose-2'-O)-methylase TrmJ
MGRGGVDLGEREGLLLDTEGNTMSRLVRASSGSRSGRARRMLRALRKSCTRARLTDRELMAMRTNLSRHCGCGAGSGQA